MARFFHDPGGDFAALDGRGPVLLVGGTVIVDGGRRAETDALLIDGERIVAHGAEAHARGASGATGTARGAIGTAAARGGAADDAPSGTADRGLPAVIDLAGRVVLPGFVDAHTHLMHTGLGLRAVRLDTARSSAEVLAAVREALLSHDPKRPLIGEDWDDSTWREGDALTGAALDRFGPAAPPIFLRRVCGHKAVANRAAVELLGARAPELDRAELVDHRRGVLLESAAMQLRRLFRPDDAEMEDALAAAAHAAAAHGITAVHDIGDARSLHAAAAHRAHGAPLLRTVFHVSGDERLAERLAAGSEIAGDAWLRLGGVKLFLDGSIGARTAALLEPYAPMPPPATDPTVAETTASGMLFLSDEELARTARAIDAHGLQLVLHAIGDRAIAQAIALLASLGESRCRERRHRIEHAELLSPPLVERLAQTGATACMQPNFVAQWQQRDGMYMRALGERRWRWMNRFRSVLERGVPLAFGSDGMPLGPLVGLEGAVQHPLVEERLSAAQAIAAYTTGADAAAPVAFEPLGTLAAGRFADFVVLDGDPRTAAHPAALRVVATVVGGRLTHPARGDGD